MVAFRLALLPRADVGAAESSAQLEPTLDGHVVVQLFNRNLEVAVNGLAEGMRQPGVRYLGGAEVRWRLLGGNLYAQRTGGTQLFPDGAGALLPGAFASVGVGVDNAR